MLFYWAFLHYKQKVITIVLCKFSLTSHVVIHVAYISHWLVYRLVHNPAMRLLLNSPTLSIHLYETIWEPHDGFSWSLILENFWEFVKTFQLSFRSDNCNDQFTRRPTCVCSHCEHNSISIYQSEYFSAKNCRGKYNTHFASNRILPLRLSALYVIKQT